jgi:hypothetical protein
MTRCHKIAKYPHEHLLRSRKAQVQETQLNWIFILIVGAIIMGFFVFIVIKQKASSEAKFAGKVTQQLNTILVGAKVSTGTVQVIPTPDLDIRFSCNDYYIGPASQRLGNRVVFAPEFVEGDELITWARDWSVPFKVSTFLYMTTPFIRYVVVDCSGDGGALDLFSALPDKLNKDYVSFAELDTVKDERDRHVRFIFVDPSTETPDIPSDFVDPGDVSGLIIYTDAPTRVKFLKGTDTGAFNLQSDDTFVCNEDEIVFGAIFSDRYDTYDCLVQRAYQRLHVVADVHMHRLDAMAPAYVYHAQCEGMYTNNAKMKMIMDATDQARISAGQVDYGALAEAKSGLINDNDRLQLMSCALIY